MNEPEKYLTPEKMNEVRQRNRSLRRQFLKYKDAEIVSMPFLFCMFSPFKKCSFLVKKILLIKQCIDSFLFFFHEFFPFF